MEQMLKIESTEKDNQPKTQWRHTKFKLENPGKNSENRSLMTNFAMITKNPKKSQMKMAVVTPVLGYFWLFLIRLYIPIYAVPG